MKKLALGLILLALVAGCGGGGSNSGGNSATLKDCQVCTGSYQCESGRCAGPYLKTGLYRCTPMNIPAGWICPVNYAKLTDGGIGENLSCQ